MDSNTWEIAFSKKFIKFGATSSTLDEDDDLIEFEFVEKVVQLSILLTLSKSDVVLLETVKGQFGVVIDIQLERILHEFLADRSSSSGQSGAEHHDLLLSWSCSEDFLYITTHIYK